jgi:hypothetical protein
LRGHKSNPLLLAEERRFLPTTSGYSFQLVREELIAIRINRQLGIGLAFAG